MMSCSKKQFILVILAFFITSCNITYKVRNTGNELEEILHMPCGEMGFELIGRGKSKFRIRHRFSVKQGIVVYPDALKIVFNNRIMDCHYPDIKKGDQYYLEGKGKYDVQFEIKEGVFDGDTIAIVGQRYIQCKDDFVNLDTVYYTFINRLRIHGVNAL